MAESAGRPFPSDPWEQLWGGITAVFASWNAARAKEYRRINAIPSDWGTAVNVQTMVFGNLGDNSATGVAFTRDPSTGERHFYGEFLINAQGEDVVAGIRTPQQLNIAGREKLPAGNEAKGLPTLEEAMPEAYQSLREIRERLEGHYRNMQDIEFTIQEGRLWMLQTRNGKRTGVAAIRIAAEMHAEGLVDTDAALLLVEPEHLDQMLHDQIDPKAELTVLGTGLPASPGAAQGEVVFSAEDAVAVAAAGRKVVLVRRETSPEDIAGMHVAQGILTSRGGMTSHAAVVARGMGKPCVAGCADLFVDSAKGVMTVGGKSFKAGDPITINGTTGAVIDGTPPLIPPSLEDPNLKTVMDWADAARRLKVRTNADTPHDARQAREFGAQGIGLCRTEHMFFGEDRIMKMREMILSDNEAARRKALTKILPMQQEDFDGIFRAMEGLPVTIRLLDPPLHEFLPTAPADIKALAKEMGVALELLERKIESLHEMNPMLGHRGCRLGLTFPEIYEMQVAAIIGAACAVQKDGVDVLPEIMIPLTGAVRELSDLRKLTIAVAEKTMAAAGVKVKYLVGTMIEIPRAALLADKMAEHADFFSFGTNDLTQMTFGYSRDDAGTFLPEYVAKGILQQRPVPAAGPGGRGPAGGDGLQQGPQGQSEDPARHLRRARRRSVERGLLPPGGPGLRQLFAVPGAHRAPGRGPGRGAGEARGREVEDVVDPLVGTRLDVAPAAGRSGRGRALDRRGVPGDPAGGGPAPAPHPDRPARRGLRAAGAGGGGAGGFAPGAGPGAGRTAGGGGGLGQHGRGRCRRRRDALGPGGPGGGGPGLAGHERRPPGARRRPGRQRPRRPGALRARGDPRQPGHRSERPGRPGPPPGGRPAGACGGADQ